ncbi:MAG: LssY C-terminal domain-containing protein, partial [Deltaproteobacteria bacterium]|nr:LssY C-terminal domain-containing protein [Deltaproteobacteria bacterium]
SPFYLFRRPQDAAFRKTRKTTDERNHLRLWLSPMLYKGTRVWIGQVSRDIRVRYLLNMYSIEPNVDEARTYILQNLWYSRGLMKYGYVKGVGRAPMSEPRENLNGDPYFTDGYRLVLWVSSEPISFDEVEFLAWEIPAPKK